MPPLQITPRFTQGSHPYENIKFTTRIAEIKDGDNVSIFRQENVEVPEFWSQTATNILASKYFYGELNEEGRERSIKQVIDRVVDSIVTFGINNKYFDEENGKNFSLELKHIFVNQMAMPNSPVLFNAGIYNTYETNKKDTFPNYYYDLKHREVKQCVNQYKHPQLSACFIGHIDDNLGSIMEMNNIAAKIYKGGSGLGFNISNLRGMNEQISGGGQSSGPLSFMEVYDKIACVVKSGGKTRRAAGLTALNADHPDILQFIRAKTDEEKKAQALVQQGYDGSFNGEAYKSILYQNNNFSVNLTDEFMKKAISNDKYEVRNISNGAIFELNARDVLKEIALGTWNVGDPAVQYIDTINKWHTCKQSGDITSSNPCGEFLATDNSACNLLSINILKFLDKDGSVVLEDYLHTIRLAIIMQDIIVDAASYPTEEITINSHNLRPLGLGLTNIGALIMASCLPYDSDEGRQFISSLISILSAQAYKTSNELAEELGTFTTYKKNRRSMLEVITEHLDSTEKNSIRVVNDDTSNLFIIAQKLWEEVLIKGKRTGFRNSAVSLLAPTGTISFLMDCDTTGIEPALSLVIYKKLTGSSNETLKIVNNIVPITLHKLGYTNVETEHIVNYVNDNDTIIGCSIVKDDHLSIFDCALKSESNPRNISYMGHLKMMSSCIPFLSGSISKTVNVNNDIKPGKIVDIYIEAWKLGLKNVAIYRDGSKGVQPLTTSKDDTGKLQARPTRKKPGKTRNAITHAFCINNYKFYLTVGLYEDGSPCEVFIKANKTGNTVGGLIDSLGIVLSKALQHGVRLEEFTEKLMFTKFEPAGITDNPEIHFANSVIDYIARWLHNEFIDKDYEKEQLKDLNGFSQEIKDSNKNFNKGDNIICSYCGEIAFRSGSCYVCGHCGSSNGCS